MIVRIRIFTLLSFIMNVIINCKTQKKFQWFFRILCKNHFQRSGFALKTRSNCMYFQITINPLYLFLSLSVLQEFESDAHHLLTKCSFHQFWGRLRHVSMLPLSTSLLLLHLLLHVHSFQSYSITALLINFSVCDKKKQRVKADHKSLFHSLNMPRLLFSKWNGILHNLKACDLFCYELTKNPQQYCKAHVIWI